MFSSWYFPVNQPEIKSLPLDILNKNRNKSKQKKLVIKPKTFSPPPNDMI